MPGPKFSIGIDLGTTNCALAYEPAGGGGSRAFSIPQWESAGRTTTSTTLPSFLYRPVAQEAESTGAANWIPGHYARKKAAETPGRVIHSAKSWLAHHAVDRTEAFLPWGSDEIPSGEKLSPLAASAALLGHLRATWDAEFAANDPTARFDLQDVTVTVPASFDAVAQRLTLEAALAAGFPKSTRLLEEPQAAFYHWLENHSGSANLDALIAAGESGARHVLVVDIGGGTTDFSLFSIAPAADGGLPHIARVAVSDHILLGGDNIDLAIAHLAEPLFAGAGHRISGSQWNFLVAQSRALKEKCLSDSEPLDTYPVSIPARGSSIFQDTLTARIPRSAIDGVVYDGFFPSCNADDRPAENQAGLKEWGLPYAADSAITRHLADFLHGRPRVDAILFNGGSLSPASLRDRLRDQIAHWQPGTAPVLLDNAELDLAVARGAARFGGILLRGSARIESGSARSIYLEVHTSDKTPSLVCILPKGASPGETFRLSNLGLALRINSPVRFQARSSARERHDQPGSIVAGDPNFHRLPPLETTIKVPGAKQPTLPVVLTAQINEIGLLQIACESTDSRFPGSWPLEFNLRADADTPDSAGSEEAPDPGVNEEKLNTARARIAALFQAPLNPRDKLSSTNLLKNLEKILGLPKAEWNGTLIRALWPTLRDAAEFRKHSVDHEETWLIFAGFLLRPGFGAPRDAIRLNELWDILSPGPVWPGKRIQLQLHILWRRVVGGLDRERQEALLAPELAKLLAPKPSGAEIVRLSGSLERIPVSTKSTLAEHFLKTAEELVDAGQHAAPYFNALGLLLNRTPLRAGPETVLSPDLVEQTFQAFGHLDWSESHFAELRTLFLRAARRTDNRHLDVPRSLAERIASKLEKSGLSSARVSSLRTYRPLEATDQSGLIGESLPPGLVLS
jgi:molecular chaperone DnaK (HSP70)